MVVWKFQLSPGRCSVEMPSGATVLSVIEQRGPVLYAAIPDESAEKVERHFDVVFTGAEISTPFPAQADFVGTVRIPGESVMHIFETMAPEDAYADPVEEPVEEPVV